MLFLCSSTTDPTNPHVITYQYQCWAGCSPHGLWPVSPPKRSEKVKKLKLRLRSAVESKTTTMRPFILLPFFAGLLFSPVSTESCDLLMTNLWKIRTDTGPPSYFFGTLHLPYTRVWHGISQEAKRAFQSADQVFLERDGGLEMDCMLLPDNKKLADMVSPVLLRRLRDWLRTEMPEMPANIWKRVRPYWLSLWLR